MKLKGENVKGKNQKNLKEENTSVVLKLIREKSGISRASVVRLTHLTPPTVSRIVSQLMKKGLIWEVIRNTKSVGRKPFSLYLNGPSYYTISVEISYSYINFGIVDLDGKIVEKLNLNTSLNISNNELINLIYKQCKSLLEKYKGSHFLGIGVSSPGMIDSERGIILSVPNFENIANLKVKEELQKLLKLPVLIANDANAEALGEKYFGEGKEAKDFVLLHIGFGIGAGIVMDSKLFHGNFGVSGEIGHVSINYVNGKLCVCGNRGCVELYAGVKEIIKNCSSVANKKYSDLGEIAFDIEHGNEKVKRVVEEDGRLIGEVLISIVNLLAPMKIIISGQVVSFGKYFLEAIKNVIDEKSYYRFGENIQVLFSKLGDDAGIVGAMTVVFDAFLERPLAFL